MPRYHQPPSGRSDCGAAQFLALLDIQFRGILVSGEIVDGGPGNGWGNSPLYPLFSSCGISQPSSNVPTALPASLYCSFPTYAYGAKTVVGGLLQGVFGVNSDRTENFNSDHRVKVKLYNFNYRVYSSIGLKVKFQKRGWAGFWDKRDCEKLVVGWDAMIFETPQVYSAPLPYTMTSFPGAKIGQVASK